jgi:predicted AlkP superfamily pyrophosphatase or phosphodiesterase
MMHTDFIKPCYDSQGFASLPQRVTELLTGPQKYEAVVLFLIDGFGWRFFEKFQQAPFLKTIAREGQVEKLIAQFPSTTAAALTTLHSGMPVGEHGIFEWYYYEPTLDAVIAPLLFSFAGTSQRDTLRSISAKPRRLFPNTTLYQSLKKQGVTSTIFQHREYTPGTYSNVVFAGATARGYRDLPEALVTLSQLLEKSSPPAYFVLYNEKIDGVGHDHGPASPQTEAEILVFLLAMEQVFLKALARSGKRTLCLLTADHGQVEIDPQTTVFINREPRFTGIEKFLRTNRQGELLVPAGSARDFFLYIQAGLVEEAQAFLTPRLEGQAEVWKVADLMSEGYFGPVLSPRFCARAGDLVILPYRYESVWWYEKDKFEQRFRGSHGGLTPQEMEIPLLMWEM